MQNKTIKFVITLEGKELDKFSLQKGEPAEIIIGKSTEKADIIINQKYISGSHLEIYKDENDNIYLTDLNSTNGVFINNNKIQPGKKNIANIGDIVTFMNDSYIQLLILDAETKITHSSANTKSNSDNTIMKILDSKSKIIIGRGSESDILLKTNFASKKHAIIKKNNDNTFNITDNNSTNGTYINERFVVGTKKISVTDKIRIGKYVFQLSDYLGNDNSIKTDNTNIDNENLSEILAKKPNVILGRGKEADIQILDNLVSRKHAKITKEANSYYVADLGSANGTYINNKKISKKTKFSENDEIRIGLKIFKLGETANELSYNTAIRAENITKKYPNNYVGLKPTTINIPSRSFIALMGPSGCGKTTLMNMLNGANPATAGKVYIHGLELTKNINTLKRKIGYVPQDDIVHKELNVNKSLYYAAKLRMNIDTTEEEIEQRINEVCDSLNINDKDIRENKVKDLSGGQRKRVSIAVELLNRPSILFLDEPTSPLDPETIDGFLNSIKALTVKENTTVVMVTHKPDDLHYVDRVVFLAKKGYPAFYGDESKLYSYFNLENKDIIGVYSTLSKTEDLKKWYAKWENIHKPVKTSENPSEMKIMRKESLIRQFIWLTKRYANIKINDTANMAILMLQPLVIPFALIYIFSELQLGVLFLMAISSIWFGVSNAAKEIVSEMPIYDRERMFNLNIFTYLFSKIAVLSVIALIQVAIFIFIIKMKFSGDVTDKIYLENTMQAAAFMFYLAFSATLLGLLLSVIFKNAEQVMSIIPIILIPQIIFAGVIADIDTKDKEILSYAMYGRWGTEGLARIQNDHEDFKVYKYTQEDSLIIDKKTVSVQSVCDESDTDKDAKISCEYEIESIYIKMPIAHVSNDTLLLKKPKDNSKKKAVPYTWQKGSKFEKTDPLKSLGFYENDKLINVFDSLNKNIIAISILNFLIFLMIFIFLKKKDKI